MASTIGDAECLHIGSRTGLPGPRCHGHVWAPTEVTIPIGQIDQIEADTVYLKLTKREIGALPAIPLRRRKT